MADFTLARQPSTTEGTFGTLEGWEGIKLHTLELPWADNKTGESCIPADTYHVVWNHSKHFGKELYQVVNVPNRTGIRIHAGNYAGSEQAGFISQVEGCILVGTGNHRGIGQDYITNSREALEKFHKEMKKRPFTLEIRWATSEETHT